MSRDLRPQRIHVAYVNVDGAIDMSAVRRMLPHAKDEDLVKPAAIAVPSGTSRTRTRARGATSSTCAPSRRSSELERGGALPGRSWRRS